MEWKDLPLPIKSKKNNCFEECRGKCYLCDDYEDLVKKTKCELIDTKCKYCPETCEHINLPSEKTCYTCCRDCKKRD